MTGNPYGDVPQPAPGKSSDRGRVSTRVIWFVIGFVASWATWALINYSYQRPRDWTQSMPKELRGDAPDWYKRAKARTVGHFTIVAASDPVPAAAIIHPQGTNFPAVFFEDDNSDGRVDRVLMVASSDLKSLTFDDDNNDGRMDSYTYDSGDFMNTISFSDNDMDGQYDLRIGPGRAVAVMIDGAWRERIRKDDKQYIELNGELVEIESVDGIWRKK